MAVDAIKSAGLTNADATPRVANNARVFGGLLREAVGTAQATASASIGSIYRLCRIPSNARISQVLLTCTAFDTTGAGDIGIYESTAGGSAVKSVAFFGSAVVMTSALQGTDVTHEAGTFKGSDIEKPLWQALGLSVDPQKDYDVCITLTAANGAGATPDVTLKVRFSV